MRLFCPDPGEKRIGLLLEAPYPNTCSPSDLGGARSSGLGQFTAWCPKNEWTLVLLGSQQLWAEFVQRRRAASVWSSPRSHAVSTWARRENQTGVSTHSKGGVPSEAGQGRADGAVTL